MNVNRGERIQEHRERILSRDQALLSHRQVCTKTGLSRTTIWRMIRTGSFPAARKISPNRCAFFADEIEAWLESKRAVN